MFLYCALSPSNHKTCCFHQETSTCSCGLAIRIHALSPGYGDLFPIPDLPVQLNKAKFEFNGNTGYQLKPWVMNREGSSGGFFNPSMQTKLEDIVPARLQVKVRRYILLLHLTNQFVEVRVLHWMVFNFFLFPCQLVTSSMHGRLRL